MMVCKCFDERVARWIGIQTPPPASRLRTRFLQSFNVAFGLATFPCSIPQQWLTGLIGGAAGLGAYVQEGDAGYGDTGGGGQFAWPWRCEPSGHTRLEIYPCWKIHRQFGLFCGSHCDATGPAPSSDV